MYVIIDMSLLIYINNDILCHYWYISIMTYIYQSWYSVYMSHGTCINNDILNILCVCICPLYSKRGVSLEYSVCIYMPYCVCIYMSYSLCIYINDDALNIVLVYICLKRGVFLEYSVIIDIYTCTMWHEYICIYMPQERRLSYIHVT